MNATFLGPILVLLAIAAGYFLYAKLARKPFPMLAAWDRLPLADLPKYIRLGPEDTPIAGESVRGWMLNEPPKSFADEPLITYAILTPRVLDFCTVQQGYLNLEFNFLVSKIESVAFDKGALPAGMAPADRGLLTIRTPSGETLMVCSADFVARLQDAMKKAA